MKKLIQGSAFLIAISLTATNIVIAQGAPPPPAAPDQAMTFNRDDQNNQDESVIIIRQKSDKNVKLNLETKGGEVFINGKPLNNFKDKDIVIEKKNGDDFNDFDFSSPFRQKELAEMSKRDAEDMIRSHQEWAEAAKINAEEISRNSRELQRQIQKSITIRINSAFLGVSSRKSDKGGATVLDVTKGSPAEKAGIKSGDIITKVNDAKIDNPDMLFEVIHNYKPGDKVKVFYSRAGKQINTMVTLDKSEPMNRSYNFDYKMAPMVPMPDSREFRFRWHDDRPKLGIKAQDAEDGNGVNILEVEDSSAAARAGLKKGDVITQFDGKDVNNTENLVDQFDEAKEKNAVKIKILRSGNPQEIEVKIPRKLKTAEL